MYTFLGLNEKPYDYGFYAPILVVLFSLYYLLFYLCLYKIPAYKDKVNEILDEFEENHQCKIRIRRQKKGFEINWNPQVKDKKGKKKKKAKGEDSTKMEFSKSKLAKSKVAPKPMPKVKKAPKKNSTEEITLDDHEGKKEDSEESLGKMNL